MSRVSRRSAYDFIFLDCPPSLGLITVNALTAADELIVPIQCEYYALEGLGQLLRNVSLVQQNINPELRLTGIVMTMFDPRTKLSEQVVEEVQRFFGDLVYDVIIPRTVRLSEAPGYGVPITVYDSKSKGAESYRLLAREVALRPPPDAPMATFDDLPDIVAPAAIDESRPPTPVQDEPADDADLPTVHEVLEEADGPEPEPKPEPEPARPSVPETEAGATAGRGVQAHAAGGRRTDARTDPNGRPGTRSQRRRDLGVGAGRSARAPRPGRGAGPAARATRGGDR